MQTGRVRATMLLITGLVSSGCAAPAGTSLPGKTTANELLERDTLFTITGMDRVEDKDCGGRRVVDRAVISADARTAVEHWDVDRCGTLVRYRITYGPGPAGGTLIGYTPGQVVGRVEPAKPDSVITLPKGFPTVWYRPSEKAGSLSAYSASGPLAITNTRIIFGDKDQTVEIDTREIKSLGWGKMVGDGFNDWVMVRYGEPQKVVGFKDGRALGWGTDTRLLYWTLKHAIEASGASPGR